MAGGNFLATAYGPPWNAMNGSGVTSTGVRLGGQVPVIAVDPSVIPYGSIVRVSNSPLGQNKLFVAADTGGAIKGNHIDFYVASGRAGQMNWGAKQIQLQMVKPGGGPGSVHSALQQVTGGQVGGGGVAGPTLTNPSSTSLSIPVFSQSFNQAGYKQAQARYIAGSAIKASESASNPFASVPGASKGFASSLGPDSGALFSKGLLSTQAPNPQDYIKAQTQLQTLAIPNVLRAHPVVQGASGHVSDIAGGFLPRGAKYIPGRQDQGRDGQTTPGGPLVADGSGVVVSVKSNPDGFGPKYPIIHMTSGPYAGRTLYFGHTLATVRPGQRVRPGQVISYTGRGPGGIGNAQTPGWFEIGFADSGSPGPMGQAAPF